MEYLILIFSAIGFFVSLYIKNSKKRNEKIFCPLGADCDAVVRSDYSKFLGINLEYLGIFYYTFIFLFYLAQVIFNFSNYVFELLFFSISFLAFLFSIHLTLIQLFKIRQFCTWCLISSFCSLLIGVGAYLVYKNSIFTFAHSFYPVFILAHALFSGIGLGVVIVVDYLFFKFLKDRKIDTKEKEVLDYLSDFIWFVLGLILVSGFFVYLNDMEKYHNSVKFQFKMIVFSVILINGVLMNLIVSPKLTNLDLKNLSSAKEKFAVVSGVVSLFSWLLAFILGRLKFLPWNLSDLILFYIIFLIVISFFAVKFFEKVKR